MSENYEYLPRAREMFAWLAQASEDVWFDCVERVNWDDDAWLLLWMVDQPQCTERLAARVFWWAGPAIFAEELFNGGSLNPNDESQVIVDLIPRNWRKGLYRKGEIEVDWVDDSYKALLARHAPRPDPLNIPEGLFVRFAGRKPIVDPNDTPEVNPYLWELHSDLGLYWGPRPGSPAHKPPEPRYHTPQYQTAGSTQNPPRGLGLTLFLISISLLGVICWFKFFK
ncbi:DUF4274 domain-containing protein [Bradyrhizobium sp. LjRoot220]|uniref:hypothetical protein n=1 Tax=Bradyrhizobium sp. LjRoot220 TaxID=3342284 RepID=UPI003ECD5618